MLFVTDCRHKPKEFLNTLTSTLYFLIFSYQLFLWLVLMMVRGTLKLSF